MYCTRCGHEYGEDAKYCEGCGVPLNQQAQPVQSPMPPPRAAQPVQPSMPPSRAAQPTAPVPPSRAAQPTAPVPPPGVPSAMAPAAPYGYAPPVAPKKKRVGLIVGVALGVLALAVLALVLALPQSTPALGTWYSEERGVILDFQPGALVVSRTPGGRDEGNYTFDEGRGKGVITADETDFKFTVDGKTLTVEGQGAFRKANSAFNAEKFLDGYRD